MAENGSIHDLFGSFRAEWLRDDIYRLFSEPAYFGHLLGNKSCVLMGGRGSGKTTVLRCLSFEGQDALGRQDWRSPNHVGIYYRVNTNIVTAFDGPELHMDEWRRLFGHFLNLTICGEFARYAVWYKNFKNGNVSDVSFSGVGRALGLGDTHDLFDLIGEIDAASSSLELFINNLGSERPMISQLQSPITKLLSTLSLLEGHKETTFHIILDEYENLLDYQQEIVNTLIKHSEENCYYKIGVRELGWRIHNTLNENESLISPADYELIHIEEKLKDDFSTFARTVCESRLASNTQIENKYLSLDALLPSMTTLEEADVLGVAKRASSIRDILIEEPGGEDIIKAVNNYVVYVFYELNRGHPEQTLNDIAEYSKGVVSAQNKYQNHAHAMLYSLADKGTQISKHYCGHDTFARIANRNIRFYMQLVHECIVEQIGKDKPLTEPIKPVDQTIAARRVGLQYLRELEGATARGSHLSKLILGLGRFFQILASHPVGGAPECNQFFLKDSGEVSATEIQTEASRLLTEAIMHLALVRAPGTKLATESDTRAWDYMPHPIFSPYFNYSTRRKRKLGITDRDLLEMSKSPQQTIKRLLGQSRQHLADAELPAQMSMFDEFFA